MRITKRASAYVFGLALLMVAPVLAAVPVVEVDEPVVKCVQANNGAGPLWAYGSTIIARDGNDVYASVIETGKDVPPLCNTRWQLWHRTDQAGWKIEQSDAKYRHREPCPISLFPGGSVFLSVNPSTQPQGTQYGPCHPQVLRFDPAKLADAPAAMEPAWAPDIFFTDHSYRGFAADGVNHELLLLNINAKTSGQFVSFMDRTGKWSARGVINFPIRGAYPQVALKNRAAYVMAIGDIQEPNAEWRKLKYEKLKSEWDYVFRRLFYTWTPDISSTLFKEPIEVDTVDATGGGISNCDLYVGQDGAVHLLYLKRPYGHEVLRVQYFPDKQNTAHLMHVAIKSGKIVARQTLAETPMNGKEGFEPASARFHVTANGDLYVVMAGTHVGGKDNVFGNFIGRIVAIDKPVEFVRLDLKEPIAIFSTNTTRGGSKPSDLLDIFGASNGLNLRYVRVRLAGVSKSQPSN